MVDDGQLIPVSDISTREERAYRAYQMRLSGMQWQEIVYRCEYVGIGEAKAEVDGLLRKATQIASDDRKREVLELELGRLDALQNAIWGMAISGDLKAVDTTLKIMAHRARILALGEETAASTTTVVVTSEKYVETLQGVIE